MRTFQRHDSSNNLHVCVSERASEKRGGRVRRRHCRLRPRPFPLLPSGRLRPSPSVFNVATSERENPLSVVLVLHPDFCNVFFDENNFEEVNIVET